MCILKDDSAKHKAIDQWIQFDTTLQSAHNGVTIRQPEYFWKLNRNPLLLCLEHFHTVDDGGVQAAFVTLTKLSSSEIAVP